MYLKTIFTTKIWLNNKSKNAITYLIKERFGSKVENKALFEGTKHFRGEFQFDSILIADRFI